MNTARRLLLALLLLGAIATFTAGCMPPPGGPPHMPGPGPLGPPR